MQKLKPYWKTLLRKIAIAKTRAVLKFMLHSTLTHKLRARVPSTVCGHLPRLPIANKLQVQEAHIVRQTITVSWYAWAMQQVCSLYTCLHCCCGSKTFIVWPLVAFCNSWRGAAWFESQVPMPQWLLLLQEEQILFSVHTSAWCKP